MKPPFDIAGDLDTPVSAFMKLAAFEPRFLLESVEGGERLARYSFIGFGDGLEVRLDGAGFSIGGERRPVPRTRRSCSRRCARRWRGRRSRSRHRRRAAGRRPGGLRRLRRGALLRAPAAAAPTARGRAAAALRGAALAAGVRSPDPRHRAAARRLRAERAALRREVVAALRGALPKCAAAAATRGRRRRSSRADYLAGVRRTQEYIAAGDVYQLVLAAASPGAHELDPFQAYRALRLINPSPYMYFCAARRRDRGRLLARGAGQAQRRATRSCGRSPARGRAQTSRAPTRARGGAARRPQGKRRARDAGRPGAQRSRARGARRQRARGALPRDRALQPRHAHGERRAAASWRRGAMPSTCSRPPFRPARWSARRRCAPCRSSTSSSR